jgi:regulator of protease activity HflC (stomatin/prohibitin superfamily)
MKGIISIIVAVVLAITGIIGYCVTHETIPAGYVGYVYDRTANENDNVIPGTSVINEERTGRIRINPFTQDVLTYPTTIISENWTNSSEGDSWNKSDMSMQIASQEGKNIDADIYISVRPIDIEKIIKSFCTKKFNDIVRNDIYGLTKGKLSSVSQAYSVYDVQASRTEIQKEVFDILSQTLAEIYGVELVRFEIGTLILPTDIQDKIDQKTQAQNEVELAKLERQKQDEVNQQIVDAQKAQSEKELLMRQTEADAAAYEITKAAEAELKAQEAAVEIAKLKVEQAKLEKEAELEKQKAYTEAYFKDKQLDVQRVAMEAINPSIKTIVTSGDGEGFDAILGLREILSAVYN